MLKSWVVEIYSYDRPAPVEQSGVDFKLAVERQLLRLVGASFCDPGVYITGDRG